MYQTHVIIKSLVLNILCIIFFLNAKTQPVEQGGEYIQTQVPCISEKQTQQIKEQLILSIEQLEKNGQLPAIELHEITQFNWPVKAASFNKDPSVFGVSNYVDHDSAVTNKLKDYNCGSRTYDLASGYNHRGVDIFSWPFQQIRQETNAVHIVAAAAGTIIFKSDGNPDKNCGFCTNCSWNAIYVQHNNGSIAFYGHLKSGSLNTKAVGETVASGEYLGVMGSSGSSTGPHLHFEVWRDQTFTQLIDPFAGPCNSLNGDTSWWNNQRPYRRPAINKIMTGSAAVQIPACPQLEVTNEKNVFEIGNPVFVTNFYQDQMQSAQTKMELIMPNGDVWQTWTQTSPNTFGRSYWFWGPWNFPNVHGYWKYRVTYLPSGQVVTHTFYHGSNPPVFTIKGGNFNDPTVWSSGVVPGSNVNVFVCHPITLNVAKTVNSLVVNENGQVYVENGISLNVINIVLEKEHSRVTD